MKGNDIHNYKNALVTRTLPHHLYGLAREAREASEKRWAR